MLDPEPYEAEARPKCPGAMTMLIDLQVAFTVVSRVEMVRKVHILQRLRSALCVSPPCV